MEENTFLLKGQLDRIELLLRDLKQTSTITQRIVDSSIRAQNEKPPSKPPSKKSKA
jgi:hypothetical protein